VMYENLGNLLLESFGGFLLVINKKGMLIFATEAITKYLGHSLSDVLGSEVKNIIHPNDCEILMQQFEMTERDDRIKDTDDETDMAHVPVSGQRSFCVKMLNVLDPQSTCYELMHLVGHLKRMPPVDGEGVPTTFSGVPSSPEPSVCLVAVAKLVSRQPIQELYPVTDSTPNQWITRHELDGKITYSDQRGALLTGFLPGESIGFSPYSLLHPDDVSSVVTVHNLFLENGCVPLTVFRMFTKSREILYVQTNTHLVIDTWTSKPKFIISINTVLEEQDGLLALEDQSRRIEDKKRCIEVVQSTCSSNTAPSSIQSFLRSHWQI
jgi:PAS domain-containing protein